MINLTIDNLNDMNKFFNDETKQWILDKIESDKKKEKTYEDAERLYKTLLNNKKCIDVRQANMYLYGDFRYFYNGKQVAINIINENNAEVRIDNYCYSTDSVEDILKVLPDIHIALEKGII